jgi:outer membrane protein X
MVNVMKHRVKFILLLLLAFAGITGIHAQEKNDYNFGVNYTVSFDNEEHDRAYYGLAAKFQYHLADLVRLQSSLTYFFRKDYLGPVDFSVDIHPLIYLSESISLYPLAGTGFSIAEGPSFKTRDELDVIDVINEIDVTTQLFLNLGGGIDIRLGSNLMGNIEFKVKNVRRDSWFNTSIGLAYLF